MTLPNDLSNDAKSIIASNLTVALTVLVASGTKEEDGKPIIIERFRSLFNQISGHQETDYAFPWMR